MAKLRKRHRNGDDGERCVLGYWAAFYDPARRPAQKRVNLRTRNEAAARQRLARLE